MFEARGRRGDVLEVSVVVEDRRIVADRVRGDDRVDCADGPQQAAIPQPFCGSRTSVLLENFGAARVSGQSGNAASSCITRVWSAPVRALNPTSATTGGQTMIEAGLCKLRRARNAARTC
jgi:hypothetical protein